MLFFVVTYGAFISVSVNHRRWILLAASYVFYATWSIPFIAVLLLSTSADYFFARKISSSSESRARKLFLAVGIACNILVLVVFKYADLLTSTIWHGAIALNAHSPLPEHVDVLLPLGISFYTFEAISYLVDVYRGKPIAQNWLEYNFYIMYFPHLISGPIVRFDQLVDQYKAAIALPVANRLHKAIELIALGAVFKCILADSFSAVSDPVFTDPTKFGVLQTYVGVLAFTAQIYFDFMGYTHIARGVSLLFNIEMPLNFNHPYNATNISDFWRRWHISLSSWIRDYLYIPLGGSRGNIFRASLNLIVVMTIAGIWHGAAWHFALWGTYHGILLSINQLWRKSSLQRTMINLLQHLNVIRIWTIASAAMTFAAVTTGWTLFRCNDLQSLNIVAGKLFRFHAMQREWHMCGVLRDYGDIWKILALIAVCTSGPLLVQVRNRFIAPMPRWFKLQLASLALIGCWLFAGAETKPFIYFRF